jgi:hypothetical protein
MQQVNSDGSAIIQRCGHTKAARVVLPADYVAEHVDLGYAVTAHRAQGVTVDTSHVVVADTTSRENLYVALTRGRAANTAYVATDVDDDHQHLGGGPVTGVEVLAGVLRTPGAETSAHQARQDECERWLGLPQLMTECQQLIDEARHHWEALPSEARSQAMRQQIATRTVRPANREMIAGFIQEPSFPIAPEVRQALLARQRLIDDRVIALAKEALAEHPAWLSQLGPRPTQRQARVRWDRALRTVVAYRNTYSIRTSTALGGNAVSSEQRLHRAIAQQSIRNLARASQPDPYYQDRTSGNRSVAGAQFVRAPNGHPLGCPTGVRELRGAPAASVGR